MHSLLRTACRHLRRALKGLSRCRPGGYWLDPKGVTPGQPLAAPALHTDWSADSLSPLVINQNKLAPTAYSDTEIPPIVIQQANETT